MRRLSARGLIAIAAAASIALLGAISTAEAGKGKGKGNKGGGGGFKVSSHVNKGAKFKSGSNFNYSKKSYNTALGMVRYGEGKNKASKHGKPNYAKKWNDDHYRRGNNVHYRRHNYAWADLPIYTSRGGCAWMYREAVETGSDHWWERYYRCAHYSRY